MNLMRFRALGSVGVLATCLWSSAAMAQEYFTQRSLNNTANSQLDRTQVSDLTFNLQEEYDSNVALTDEALASARGLKQSDEIFTPSIGLNVYIPRGLWTFFSGGEVGYNFYSHDHALNRANINVYGGASAHFICQDTLVGDFEDVRQNDIISPTSAISNSVAAGGVDLRVACGQKYGLAPTASVGERWATNSEQFFAPTDYRMLTASAELAYNRPVLGSLGLYGEYNDLTYIHDLDLFGFQFQNGYRVYTGGLRFKHYGSRLYIDARVAYTDLSPYNSFTPGFNGLSYGVDVRYNTGPRLQMNAGITRAAVPTDLPFASYSVDNTYHAGIDFAASDRLRLGIGGEIDHDEYRGTPFVLGLAVTDQTVYRANAQVDFWVTRDLDLVGFVSEVHRDTPTPGYTYTATIVGARITAKLGN